MTNKVWKKYGTCKHCNKRLPLKVPNVLPAHYIKNDLGSMLCQGSGNPGTDHKYEKVR